MKNRSFKSRPLKLRRKHAILLILFIVLFVFVQGFIFVERNLREPLMNIAKVRLKQIATQAINTAITENIGQSTDLEQLIDWRMDNNGKVSGFMLNYAEHLKITAEAIEIVEGILKELEENPESVPVGQAFNSAILATIGPNVSVKLTPAGSVKVELSTRQQDAGINMLLVEVFVEISTEVTVIIPFSTDTERVQLELPISYVLVVGDVPMYYFDNRGNPVGEQGQNVLPPNISLPGVQP